LAQLVDEDAIALVGGDAPRGGVRRRDEAVLLELRHVVADRRARHPEGVALDDRLRADGLARRHVVLHDDAQDGEASLRDHEHHLPQEPDAGERSCVAARWHSGYVTANTTARLAAWPVAPRHRCPFSPRALP